MSDVRARLAATLRDHQRRIDCNHPGYGRCYCGFDPDSDGCLQPWEFQAEHIVDVLLALPGVAIVELPTETWPNNSGVGFGQEVMTYKGRVLVGTDLDLSADYARTLASTLLAAAAFAQQDAQIGTP